MNFGLASNIDSEIGKNILLALPQVAQQMPLFFADHISCHEIFVGVVLTSMVFINHCGDIRRSPDQRGDPFEKVPHARHVQIRRPLVEHKGMDHIGFAVLVELTHRRLRIDVSRNLGHARH
ncbi:hypothetical protein [Sinorhizobium fredii]|uniref:hypothetical protein n=1 Tax=Rhizobium fredii TaxID=380 RepID=UPI0013E8BF90|nr:hypothetical protein [Sinorhizobium fredii]